MVNLSLNFRNFNLTRTTFGCHLPLSSKFGRANGCSRRALKISGISVVMFSPVKVHNPGGAGSAWTGVSAHEKRREILELRQVSHSELGRNYLTQPAHSSSAQPIGSEHSHAIDGKNAHWPYLMLITALPANPGPHLCYLKLKKKKTWPIATRYVISPVHTEYKTGFNAYMLPTTEETLVRCEFGVFCF